MTKPLEALIADMKAAAEKATQGDWCTDSQHGICADAGLNGNFYIATCSGPEYRPNANFIAKVSPANVMALIAALEQAQEKFKRLDERNSTLNSTLDRWAVERAESANTIAELESQNLTTSNALLDAGKKIAELEVSQLAVKLPRPATPLDAAAVIRACMDEFPEDVRDIVEECAVIAENTIRAAGGTVGGE